MAAEGSRDVMILPMNIIGDCAAHSNVFRSRSDGQEKTSGHGKVEDLSQRNPCLAAENARSRIEVEQAIHAARVQQRAVFEQADVAVAAARSHRKLARGWSLAQWEIAFPFERDEGGVESRISAPAFKAGSLIGSRHGGLLAPCSFPADASRLHGGWQDGSILQQKQQP